MGFCLLWQTSSKKLAILLFHVLLLFVENKFFFFFYNARKWLYASDIIITLCVNTCTVIFVSLLIFIIVRVAYPVKAVVLLYNGE